MKRIPTLFLLLVFLISQTSLSASNQNLLKLKTGTFEPQTLDSNMPLNLAVANHSTSGYYIVQFNAIPTEAEKAAISNNGVALLEYLPEYAFLAYSDIPSSITLAALNIRSIVNYDASLKVHPELAAGIYPTWVPKPGNRLALSIDIHQNGSITALENKLISLSAEITEISFNNEYIVAEIEKSQLDNLASDANVKFISFAEAPPEIDDTRARSLHRGNMLDSDHPLGKKYDGSGVAVAIADDGDIGPHIDTKGRVTSFAPASRGTHGDMTTGITMGAGNVNPRYRGMATDAYLYYYDISGYPHVAQAVNNLNTRGVHVTSTSYSEGCNAGYTNTTRGVDQQTRQNPTLLHVFSAGNSANSNCGFGAGTPWGTITGGRKMGKNVIATGNLEYQDILTGSSSRGPAADGRIKPDICANGTNQISTDPNNSYSPGGGTSAAAPGIAGLAVQMIDGYRQINGGTTPESGLIKGAMLNTARDLGNPGPDFFYGWGRVNVHRAFKLLEENRYLSGTITQGATVNHTITVANPMQEMRVMVYWTDFEAATNAAKDLVNDLDITLYMPNGDSLKPWVLNPTPNANTLNDNAVRGIDRLNNMEQVSFTNVPAGTYTVKINGFAVPQGPQKYFLLWEPKANEIEVTYPSGGEPMVIGELETIRWDAVGNTGTFSIQYSPDAGTTWLPLVSNLAGSRRYYNFAIPSTVTGDALVRVTRGSVTGVSANTFSVISMPNVTVQYTCPDSVKLNWQPVNGANAYEVSMLGAKHMDSIGRSTSNSFTIYNLNLLDDNWFSVRALNTSTGIYGQRTNAVQLPNASLNCPLGYDIGITMINSPNTGNISNCNIDKLPVQVTIQNAGDSSLINVPVRLVANGTTYNDTIKGPLAPKSFQFFTFKDSILLVPGTMIIDAIADLPGDQNEANDSIRTTVTVSGGQVFTIPYANDFESFSTCSNQTNCGATVCNLSGGWVNVSSPEDGSDLRVWSGTTVSTGTGPTADHNPGTAAGKYIYSEASNCFGSESHMISPCFDLTGTISPELSFWYHMNGATMGILRIDIQSDGNWQNNVMTPLFGDQGTNWLNQTLDLSPWAGKRINIRFRVTNGSSWTSDLALDDISIVDQSVGLNELEQKAYSLFPNPSTGVFNLQFEQTKNRIIQVYDMRGQLVRSMQSANNNIQMDLSDIDKGIYFLNIVGEEKRNKIVLY